FLLSTLVSSPLSTLFPYTTLFRSKFFHLIGHLLHAAITRKKNKCASLRFLGKMRDPMLERFLITDVARVGHFLDNEHFHLFLEIDRKSTRLNSSHGSISYAVFCLK